MITRIRLRPGLSRAAIRAAFEELSPEQLRRSQRAKWEVPGPEVLPAWVADMDLPIAPPIQQRIDELVEQSDFGYHRLPFDPRLVAALRARQAKLYNWHFEPWQVYALSNLVQGLFLMVHTYSDPGDAIVVMSPIYPPFIEAVELSGRRLVQSDLVRGDSRYEVDFESLEAALSTQGARVLLLCNPHNPTGRSWEKPELERIGELALKYNVTIISDEVHADLTYSGNEHTAFMTLSPELAENTVTLTSATKAFNLAGLPTALLVIGSRRLKDELKKTPSHILGHGGILGSEAAITAWTHPESDVWLQAAKEHLEANRNYLAQRAEELNIPFHPPEATYLAWLDFRAHNLKPDPKAWLLEHAQVELSDGQNFGQGGQGFVRLNFATSRQILKAILDRMEQALGA